MANKSNGESSLDCFISFAIPRANADVIRASARERGMTSASLIRASLAKSLNLSDGTTDCVSHSCVICGSPLPVGKTCYCSDECKREGHRRAAAESLRRKRAVQSKVPED